MIVKTRLQVERAVKIWSQLMRPELGLHTKEGAFDFITALVYENVGKRERTISELAYIDSSASQKMEAPQVQGMELSLSLNQFLGSILLPALLACSTRRREHPKNPPDVRIEERQEKVVKFLRGIAHSFGL
jgi:hypothetical protein